MAQGNGFHTATSGATDVGAEPAYVHEIVRHHSQTGSIGFFWQQFGAYHMDRCIAVAQSLAMRGSVIGLELATASETYAWEPTQEVPEFLKVTLFPGQMAECIKWPAILWKLMWAVQKYRIRHLFVSGYESPASFLLAIIAPLLGCRVYVVLDSKFDDKPRGIYLEFLKHILLLPYRGGFASGVRAAAYLRFLGFRRRSIALGYDTVSIRRLRGLVTDRGIAWRDRPFVAVARFVPKKNLAMLLHAYALYRRKAGTDGCRRLQLCGSGPLEQDLRRLVRDLAIQDTVDFSGFLSQSGVAQALSEAVCLLLPSVEEQWGLVVNEALAFGLPILAATGVGASDTLIRNFENGLILDPQDPEVWMQAMTAISSDQSFWERLYAASNEMADRGDVRHFANGVEMLISTGIERLGATQHPVDGRSVQAPVPTLPPMP